MDDLSASLLTMPSQHGLRPLLVRLWREYVLRYRARLLLVLVLTILLAALQAAYPLVLNHTYDMIEHRDARILYQIPALIIAITTTKAAVQYGQNVAVQSVVMLVVRALQGAMFDRMAHADLVQVEREAPAQTAARFTTDAVTIREAMVRAVNALGDATMLVGLAASLIYLDWALTLVALLLYPLAALPIDRIGRRIRRSSAGLQERIGETAAMLTESFSQARTVRAYRLEAAETHRAERAFADLYNSSMRMIRGRARLDPLLEMLGGAAIAAVIGFAGWRSATGVSSLGSLTSFVAALFMASRPLRALGNLNAALQEGAACLVRCFSVIDQAPRIADAPGAIALPSGHGRLEFSAVQFVYPDGRAGLRGLDFIAEPGRTVALVGASGAGKSTALALVPRLIDATGGTIRIDGADVRAVTLASLRDAIAYVGQDTLLFDDTVAANIAMGRPGATREKIEAAARDAAAADFIAALPLGYQTVVGPGGGRLSGGQRQRIVLARALLRNPRILLLDEATSALDADSEKLVQEALAVLRRDRTTIIVAHRLSTVRDADLVVVMADGRATEQGTHATLMAEDGDYARLVKTQSLLV